MRRGSLRLTASEHKWLDAYREALAAQYPSAVERMIIYGSKARGDAGPDSDYDLPIVTPDDAPPQRRDGKLAYEALWGVGASVDAVVCRSSWFNARTHLKASLPGTVLREGRLLHAA